MSAMRILSYGSGTIAVVSIVLAIVTRFLVANKVLFGLAALSYLRFAQTMLLLALVLMIFEFIRKYKTGS